MYFDPRVTQVGRAGRGKRTLKFNEPGTVGNGCGTVHFVLYISHCLSLSLSSGKYIKQAQTMRAKAQLEKLQSEIASTARKTGISSATKLALLAPGAEAVSGCVCVFVSVCVYVCVCECVCVSCVFVTAVHYSILSLPVAS